MIAGAKFSTFDLSEGFHQVDYDEKSLTLTTLMANHRRYMFNKMVMGCICLIDRLLADMPIAYFLDDRKIASEDRATHTCTG